MTADMTGRTVVLTGGSSGIGEAAVRAFRKRGATVAMTGRSPATHRIAEETGADAYIVDYTDFAAVRAFADSVLAKYPRIDVLVNNVGGMFGKRRLTRDGHEQTLQVNHLAGFLLTGLLRERIGESGGRVINTASLANRRARLDFDDLENARRYTDLAAYADAKLMNILHMMEFARRNPAIPAASFHPGLVVSEFGRDASPVVRFFYESRLGKALMISPETGSDTMVWLATSEPGRDWVSGEYYYKRRPGRRNRRATPENARRLWEISEKLVGLA
jgi:NAD(P)-dependent dehydrogenase (short-subunit alcohol dehydrogenase family)